MLSDRSYMRDHYPREKTSVLIWLACATFAGFVIQFSFGKFWPKGGDMLVGELGLSVDAVKSGRIWTLFTHSFLHEPGFLFHVVANLLGLYFLGRELLPVIGSRRFLSLYFGAILVGALTWLGVHW